jgi:hypothetical protein
LKPSRGGWFIALICLSMLAVAALVRNADPAELKSVMVEPLEAAAFVILVARTAAGFHGHIARFLTNPRAHVCRADQLRPLHLPHSGGDGVQSVAALANALPNRDTIAAVDLVWRGYASDRGIILVAVGATDQPAPQRENANSARTCTNSGSRRR